MVADKLIRDYMKYDYGDDVVVKAQDQSGVEKPGTVVGISPVENAEQSRIFAYPIGTVLYTIEFGDGSDALLPEERLEPLVTEN